MPAPESADDRPDQHLGRPATAPHRMPWRAWRAVLLCTAREMISDRMSLIAAGCAFYATLALFPAITMLIFIYGLLLDPATIGPQLDRLPELLPQGAYTLIENRIQWLINQPRKTLGLGVAFSGGLVLWSSATGTKAIISALNIAYKERERRSFLHFQVLGLAMTLCALLGTVLVIAVLVAIPAVIAFLGMSGYAEHLTRIASLAVLFLFLLISLSLLYQYGPSRATVRWRWVTPGSLVAAFMFIAASVLVSFYIGKLARYDATYGPLSAVVGVMMWFWASIYAVLLGAELNSELEMQTGRAAAAGEGQSPG